MAFMTTHIHTLFYMLDGIYVDSIWWFLVKLKFE